MSLMPPLLDHWASRSPREQLLAMVVAILAIGMLLVVGIQSARSTLLGLDRDIERLSTDLVNAHYQVARRQSVDKEFSHVAAQHSSTWSESEIRDRLRQEIYRLANRVPPELDGNGIPLSTNSDDGALVSIPTLGQGHLKEGGEGYREYYISVHIPTTPIANMIAYLERLQGSPQSLRLDDIDMRRDPTRNEVSADLGITRIVVDTGVVPSADLQDSASDTPFVQSDWHTEGCAITLERDNALTITATRDDARAWIEQPMPPASTYDLYLHLSTTGPAEISVAVDGETMSGDAVAVNSEDGAKAVEIRFTAPDAAENRSAVHVPTIQLQNRGTTVRLFRNYLHQVAQP